jgi:hypothetical protein
VISPYRGSIPFVLFENEILKKTQKLFAPYTKEKQFSFSPEHIKKTPVLTFF